MSAVSYPDAHLLSLPRELREQIYDHLAEHIVTQWQKNTPLHISASSPPSLSLILAHRRLYTEALAHFYRRTTLTIDIDAFDAVQSYKHTGTSEFQTNLSAYPHLKFARTIELRPRMNAGVEVLRHDVDAAVTVLLEEAKELKTVIVGWSETPITFLGSWRPWPYKAPALEPLRRLVGRWKIEVGEAVIPPPRTAEKEQEGLRRVVEMVVGGDLQEL